MGTVTALRQRPHTSWQVNADAFAELDRGEGWPFAILVACSVEKGAGQGARQPRVDRHEVGKTSAQAFARRAGTSPHRILRYLNAWEKAAADGVAAPAESLAPADAATLTQPEAPFSKYYDASEPPRAPRDVAAIISRDPAAVVAALDDKALHALVHAATAEATPAYRLPAGRNPDPMTANAVGRIARSRRKKKSDMARVADEFARILNAAHTLGIAVTPSIDREGVIAYKIERAEGGVSIDWSTDRQRWLVTPLASPPENQSGPEPG